MKRASREPDRGPAALPGTGALLDKLNSVRRRKRAYGGQAVDMEALRRLVDEEKERQGDGQE